MADPVIVGAAIAGVATIVGTILASRNQSNSTLVQGQGTFIDDLREENKQLKEEIRELRNEALAAHDLRMENSELKTYNAELLGRLTLLQATGDEIA